MTSRFERLGSVNRGVIVLLIIAVSSVFLPMQAQAQESNTRSLVFEIKTLQIPNATEIADQIFGADEVETDTITISTPPTPQPVPVAIKKPAVKKPTYTLPPKTVGDARIYMHEPSIRAYVCPKLGAQCNTFIAVLKAENGTHECTRDNRGLNRNGSVDIGLAQINWRPGNPYHTFEQLQDCKYNLDVALDMYKRRGFQPWYAYTKGAYLKHMPAVLASAKAIAAEPVVLTN
jgi:hypothetical protein